MSWRYKQCNLQVTKKTHDWVEVKVEGYDYNLKKQYAIAQEVNIQDSPSDSHKSNLTNQLSEPVCVIKSLSTHARYFFPCLSP